MVRDRYINKSYKKNGEDDLKMEREKRWEMMVFYRWEKRVIERENVF